MKCERVGERYNSTPGKFPPGPEVSVGRLTGDQRHVSELTSQYVGICLLYDLH